MLIEVTKIFEAHDRTISLLKVDGKEFCFTLEDGYREEKVAGETRIPAGRYKIAKRTIGKFFTDYRRRFKHEFSIQVMDVPGFSQILLHIGNDVEDTRGCLLVGNTVAMTGNPGKLYVNQSTNAYKALYSHIANAFAMGEKIEIDIKR